MSTRLTRRQLYELVWDEPMTKLAAQFGLSDAKRPINKMSAVALIAFASTVSLLAGWRLYLVTFVVGLGMKLGWLALPAQLHGLDILASNWIIGIAAVGAVAEFFADKDSLGG
jgi:hypothetical protein